MKENILAKNIKNNKAKIGVIGLGYVGLPLAVSFAEAGLRVIGIDCNKERVKELNRGKSYILDVASKKVEKIVKQGLFSATNSYKMTRNLDAIIICVPTPLSKTREPDISYILSAIESITKNRNIKKKQIIVLESTTYPGTTDEAVLPKLETPKCKVDRDFYLAFSPERIDPSNKVYKTHNIPKVIGGVTASSGEMAKLLYSKIVKEVFVASSSRVAEMAKLLENTFRSVNIGLVNEMALMCEKMDVDVWEVIEAAKTKPFGFMPFYPGPGIGGHCINIDPLYLSWKASLFGFRTRLITIADRINSGMPAYVVKRTIKALKGRKKGPKNADVLILGLAYKRDVNDTRESPSLEIIRLLAKEKVRVSYSDPYVPEMDIEGLKLKSVDLDSKILRAKDCVILATDHGIFDYGKIAKSARLIIDTRNAFKKYTGKNIVKL